MRHLMRRDLSLVDADAAALAHARRLTASYPRLEGDGDGGDGGDGGAGDGTGDGDGDGAPAGDGDGDGTGDGEPTPLQQQALDAIEQLRSAGTEIPQALEAAVNELRTARSEAADYRTKLRDVETKQQQTDQTLQQLAAALGVASNGNGNGDPPDPADLQKTIDQTSAENRRLRVMNALGDVLDKHGADRVLTRAVLNEQGVIDDLDPTADDFQEKLDKAVVKALEGNPKLKAGQAPGKSGAEHNGGGGGPAKPKNLRDAVANAYAS